MTRKNHFTWTLRVLFQILKVNQNVMRNFESVSARSQENFEPHWDTEFPKNICESLFGVTLWTSTKFRGTPSPLSKLLMTFLVTFKIWNRTRSVPSKISFSATFINLPFEKNIPMKKMTKIQDHQKKSFSSFVIKAAKNIENTMS